MLPQIKIYSVFHKEAPVPAAEYVIPVFVGASQPTISKCIKDNTCEHIANLNGSFAELTACYWIWKNAEREGVDAWGICHYRRYFTFTYRKYFLIKKSRKNFNLNQENIDAIVSKEMYLKLQELLATHDVILQRPEWALKKGSRKYSIKEAYAKAHHLSDWEVIIQIILKKYPEYKKSILLFENQKIMSYYNMMVARWEIWDHYLQWLFDILFDTANIIEAKADASQQRVFGFLSERLLNLYVMHHNLRPAYLTIALFEK